MPIIGRYRPPTGLKPDPGDVGLDISNPLADRLVAAPLFNEGAGSVLHDYSAYGHDGTINGATWGISERGLALDFGGTDYVAMPANMYSTADYTSRGITMAAWYKTGTEADDNSYYGVLGGQGGDSHTNTSAGGIYVLDGISFYQVTFVFFDGTYDFVSSGIGDTLVGNTWYHLCAVVDPATSTYYLYINGKLANTGAFNTAGSYYAPVTFNIGRVRRAGAWTYAQNGSQIAQADVYRRALDASEVFDLHREPYERFFCPRLYFVPAAGGTDALTADDIAGAAPSLDSPALSQAHALTGSDLAGAGAVLDSPALSQVHGLTGSDLAASAGVLDTPTLSESHALTADDLAAAGALLDAPALAQVHALAGLDLAGAGAVLDAGVLAQVHALIGDGISIAILLDQPALSSITGPAPPGRTVAVGARTRVIAVDARGRTVSVPARIRTITIPSG